MQGAHAADMPACSQSPSLLIRLLRLTHASYHKDVSMALRLRDLLLSYKKIKTDQNIAEMLRLV